MTAVLAIGAPPGKARAAEAGQTAQALTQSLVSGAARYSKARQSAQAGFAAQLRELAAERRAVLLQLAQEAPEEVLQARLPARVVERLPSDVRAMLEYQGAIEGELQVVQIDHEDAGRSYLTYGLVTDFGQRVSLHFAKAPTHRLTGERVIARGLILEGDHETAMVLESGEEDLEQAYCCTGGGGGTEAELPNTFGAQSTAVLLVNFADDTSQPWTVAEIHGLMFGPGGVSDYFYEASHQQTWLEGDAFGWLTVDAASDDCSLFSFADLAYQAAADAGIDLSTYDRRVIFTPERPCWFNGIASIGGSPSVARLDGIASLYLTAHEMGHNFGLQHGHALDCGLETLAAECTSMEYGDTTETMGFPDPGHFGAFQKQRLGWLAEAVAGELESVSASGSYTLEPYETLPGTLPKAVRVPAGIDPANGKQRWLYLTYRQPIGFDSFYADRSYSEYCREDVTDGVYAHLGTDSAPNSSFLLNMRTDSCYVEAYGSLDWYNPSLATGDSFVIPDTGTHITVDSAGPAGASVFIDMSAAPLCVTGDPLVEVQPVADGWGAPGEAVDYAVTVTSTDSPECSGSSFDLAADAPVGWHASFGESALSLAPGASGSTDLRLTSAADAPDGSYDAPVAASRGTDAGTDIATYVVSGALANQPPVAKDDSATTSPKTAVNVAVLANDADPDGDPLTVIHVTAPGNGSVEVNGDGSVTYTPHPRAKDSDSFTYTISDGAGTASAAVQIAISTDDGGGEKDSGGWGKGGKK